MIHTFPELVKINYLVAVIYGKDISIYTAKMKQEYKKFGHPKEDNKLFENIDLLLNKTIYRNRK